MIYSIIYIMSAEKPSYKIIAGLGNPGKEYENTYHNAGFLAVDYFINKVKKLSMKEVKAKNFEYAENGNAIFVKTLTYMNDSGLAIKNSLRYFKASPDELLVMHDDSDILLGEYKLSFERGSGGHKGIESIIAHLKTNKFWRIRIGIRPPGRSGAPRKKAVEFVLKNISPAHKRLLMSAFASIAKQINQL